MVVPWLLVAGNNCARIDSSVPYEWFNGQWPSWVQRTGSSV